MLTYKGQNRTLHSGRPLCQHGPGRAVEAFVLFISSFINYCYLIGRLLLYFDVTIPIGKHGK